jgi:hypothetical protein
MYYNLNQQRSYWASTYLFFLKFVSIFTRWLFVFLRCQLGKIKIFNSMLRNVHLMEVKNITNGRKEKLDAEEEKRLLSNTLKFHHHW